MVLSNLIGRKPSPVLITNYLNKYIFFIIFFMMFINELRNLHSGGYGYLFLGIHLFLTLLLGAVIIWTVFLDISRWGFLLVTIPLETSLVSKKIGEMLFSNGYSFTRKSQAGRLPVFPMRYFEIFSLRKEGLYIRLKCLPPSRIFEQIMSKTLIEIGPIKEENEYRAREVRRSLNELFQLQESPDRKKYSEG